MSIDLLWFDGDKHTPMALKISNAIVHYEKKYETPARVVRVSSKDRTDLGDAEFLSTIDLQPVIILWASKVHKGHMSLSSALEPWRTSELTQER